MTLPISLQDDDTSHGGKVLLATGTLSIDGRRNARIGDLVSCPRHGDNRITGPAGAFLDNGIAVALHGCSSECGSTVIAGSKFTVAV